MIFVKDENRRTGAYFNGLFVKKAALRFVGVRIIVGRKQKRNCCKIVANILPFFGDFCFRNTIYFNRKQKLANKPKGA